MKSNTDYPYRGLPIKPEIIVDLIKELFAGKLVERQEIIEQVRATHLKRGGLPSKAINFPLSVTKALARMQKAEKATKVSYGYWKILPTDTEIIPEIAKTTDVAVLQNTEATAQPPDDSIGEVVLGTGPGSVYLYYLPTYRARAAERKESSWQCKIGRTKAGAVDRIFSQVGTALPEKPIVAVVLRTKYPAALEAALQSVLTLRGLAIEEALGNEWFLTSPAEVIALAKNFDPQSYDATSQK